MENKNIELYGNYWIIEKRNIKQPIEITITRIIDEDKILYTQGHYTKDEVDNTNFPFQKTANKNIILQKLTEKQKQQIEKQKMIQEQKQILVWKILNEFDVKIPLLSSATMELEELQRIYNKLKHRN